MPGRKQTPDILGALLEGKMAPKAKEEASGESQEASKTVYQYKGRAAIS